GSPFTGTHPIGGVGGEAGEALVRQRGGRMEVRPAGLEDVVAYVALGRPAQEWLRSRGLGQYVPAAHEGDAAAIHSRVELGPLCGVRDAGRAAGFSSRDEPPSPWWPGDGPRALSLAGRVVAGSARGRGVGGFIIEWCAAEPPRRGRRCMRLDCHAGNPWLCR